MVYQITFEGVVVRCFGCWSRYVRAQSLRYQRQRRKSCIISEEEGVSMHLAWLGWIRRLGAGGVRRARGKVR
jgi:hypothetical protein